LRGDVVPMAALPERIVHPPVGNVFGVVKAGGTIRC
jgi:hypothetical protein